MGSCLAVFYLGDEEISSSCLVAPKSNDPSIVTRKFDTLVIGRRDSLHRMDPWCAQDCVIWIVNVDDGELDVFGDAFGVHSQAYRSEHGLG